MLIELTLGGVQYAGTVERVVKDIPDPTPTPDPTPVPVPTQPDGFTTTVNPKTIYGEQFVVGTGKTFLFSCPPNTVFALPILYNVFDPRTYAGISTNQRTENTNIRDAVISTAPGSMTGINPYARKMHVGLGASFDIAFNGEAGYVPLQKGIQYWLNIKAVEPEKAIDFLVVA